MAVLIDNFISATVEMEADKAAAEAAVLKRKEQVPAPPAAVPGSEASDAGRTSLRGPQVPALPGAGSGCPRRARRRRVSGRMGACAYAKIRRIPAVTGIN